MRKTKRALVCDDDSLFLKTAEMLLTQKGLECTLVNNGDQALDVLNRKSFDLMLTDIAMRSPNEGLVFIPRIRGQDVELPIIVVSGRKDFETVKEAMRLGATDYVPKDFQPEEFYHAVDRVFRQKELENRISQTNFELFQSSSRHKLVGSSRALEAIRTTLERIKTSTANVVISGETGCGKEIVARQLRCLGRGNHLAPFVAVDSATIQSSMAESILFGHEKGAFTGADQSRKGIFEEADGGIVYFDEISNMPLDIQAKLLRVMQEKEIVRVGSSRPIPLEFRVVCATNQRLEDLIREGRFKEDLYQRLNVIPLEIPPLREHTEDIPELLDHFVRIHGKGRTLEFSQDCVDALKAYTWPGNVRELSNLVAYLFAMVDHNDIDISDLPPKIREARFEPPEGYTFSDPGSSNFYDRVAHFERELLSTIYKQMNGNIKQMAMHLGMDRSHLYTKLRIYEIHSTKAP